MRPCLHVYYPGGLWSARAAGDHSMLAMDNCRLEGENLGGEEEVSGGTDMGGLAVVSPATGEPFVQLIADGASDGSLAWASSALGVTGYYSQGLVPSIILHPQSVVGTGIVPPAMRQVGAAPYIPTRPSGAEREVLFTTRSRQPIGSVRALVAWTTRVDGPASLDSLTVPKWFTTKHGLKVSKPDLARRGWCVRFVADGRVHWFTLDRIAGDNETSVTFTGYSIERRELSQLISSMTMNSFERVAWTEEEIMYDLLNGIASLAIDNAGLEEISVLDGIDYAAGWLYVTYTGAGDPPSFPADGKLSSDYFGNCLPVTEDAGGGRWDVLAKTLTIATGLRVTWIFPNDTLGWYARKTADYGNTQRGIPTIWGAPPGAEVTVSVDARVTSAAGLANWASLGGLASLELVWYGPDRTTIAGTDTLDLTALLTEGYQTLEATFTRKSDYFTPCVKVYQDLSAATGSGASLYFENLTLAGANFAQPSGWTFSSEFETRDPNILHTDIEWIEFGTWTVGETDRRSNIVKNRTAYVVTGDTCFIHFAAGGAGAKAKILVNDAVAELAYDVSGAATYEVLYLDGTRENLIGIEVAAGEVRVEKLVVSTENRFTVHWSDMDGNQCLSDLVTVHGGEIVIDADARHIDHVVARGRDLRAENVLELRRGKNLLGFPIDRRRDTVCNRLVFLGYGEGQYRLRIIVDATGTNEDGDTSQEVYEVQPRKYEDPNCQDWYLGQQKAKYLVNKWQWDAVSYRPTVPDATAALMEEGDTIRCYWDDDPSDIVDVSVRVLEISRDNQGNPAALVVGDRVEDLPDYLVELSR
jgi:hypothetical protein